MLALENHNDTLGVLYYVHFTDRLTNGQSRTISLQVTIAKTTSKRVIIP